MNIHEITEQGSGHRLGPVTVTKTFPSKPGDTSVFLLVKDESGSTALKIWGCPSNQAPQLHHVISLVTDGGPKSSIVNKEYPVGSGKFSINASGCQIVREGGAASSSEVNSNASAQEPKGDQTQVNCAIAEQAFQVSHAFFNLWIEAGFSRAEAIQLTTGSHDMKPLFWGGAKFLG